VLDLKGEMAVCNAGSGLTLGRAVPGEKQSLSFGLGQTGLPVELKCAKHIKKTQPTTKNRAPRGNLNEGPPC